MCASLTQSINFLEVSPNMYKLKHQKAQRSISSSILKHSKHEYPDMCNSDSLFSDTDYVVRKRPHLPSDLHIDSMLSAPPPFRLHVNKPVQTPQTIGYSTFVMVPPESAM
jgi:hypothetical protein